MSAAPADVVLATLRGARVATWILFAPAVAYVLLNTGTGWTGSTEAHVGWLPLAFAVFGLQAYLLRAALQRRTPRWGLLAWLAMAACVAVLITVIGPADLPALWFVAAGGAVVLQPRLSLLALAANIVLFVGLAVLTVPETTSVANVWYAVVAAVAGATGPFLATRLLEVVDGVARSRAELELTAADEERLRLSRDLHDALGQGLSAVALKGDLALALLEKDPAAAHREIDSLTAVTQRLRAELPGIVAAGQPASYALEADRAERLLREAGIDVRRDGELGDLPAAADSALGWVVREAATNVLRHSDAQRWTVLAGRGASQVWLEMTNDRPQPAAVPDRPGTGLVGMAERLRTVGGRVRTDGDAGRFVLRVEVAT